MSDYLTNLALRGAGMLESAAMRPNDPPPAMFLGADSPGESAEGPEPPAAAANRVAESPAPPARTIAAPVPVVTSPLPNTLMRREQFAEGPPPLPPLAQPQTAASVNPVAAIPTPLRFVDIPDMEAPRMPAKSSDEAAPIAANPWAIATVLPASQPPAAHARVEFDAPIPALPPSLSEAPPARDKTPAADRLPRVVSVAPGPPQFSPGLAAVAGPPPVDGARPVHVQIGRIEVRASPPPPAPPQRPRRQAEGFTRYWPVRAYRSWTV